MNPELPRAHPTPEAMPQIPGSAEYLPDGSIKSTEVMPVPEVGPARPEQPVQPVQSIPPVAIPQVPAPVAPAPVSQPQTPTTDDNPVVAADEDLIEKEWVDKAKKIIALTKGNPYEQAKAIAALQSDYLKKRYNRELGENVKS